MANETIQAQRFIDALEQDAYLQAQLAIDSPNSLSAVVDFASAKGYSFSKDELEAALTLAPDSAVVSQLRQYIGTSTTESGIVSDLLTQ